MHIWIVCSDGKLLRIKAYDFEHVITKVINNSHQIINLAIDDMHLKIIVNKLFLNAANKLGIFLVLQKLNNRVSKIRILPDFRLLVE
jgi:hypothetical protein